jgi:hypothetical protein
LLYTLWSRAPVHLPLIALFICALILQISMTLAPIASRARDSQAKSPPANASSFHRTSITSSVSFCSHHPVTMLVTRGFSLTNFVIGSSALCFQIFVLYPWHHKLDEEFTSLRQEHARLLEDTRERHRDELRGIRKELELLNERVGSKTGGFWS